MFDEKIMNKENPLLFPNMQWYNNLSSTTNGEIMAVKGQKRHISVIMPAYNAEKYLEAAVGSILAQTYVDFDLIIVNDGSSDATPAIAENLSQRDSRISVVSVPNGGPAAARNIGLDTALGLHDPDFIMFSDADDEYLPDAFEKAVKAADTGAEIVFLGFTIVNPDGSRNDYFEPDAEYTPDTVGSAFPDLYKANLLNQVWGKLFSADLIRRGRFRFLDYRWGEDRLFIYDCLEKAGKISVKSYCGYLYKMYNSASLISGYYDRKPDVCIYSDGRVRELCEKFGVNDDADCRYMFMKSIFSCLTNLYSPSCRLSGDEKRKYAKRILDDSYVLERVRGTGGGTAAKMLSSLISTRSVFLNLSAAKLMTVLSASVPLMFQKIKHRK